MNTVRLGSHPLEAIHPIAPGRVHDRGRVTHQVIGGVAHCGEQGTRWRSVAGCPAVRPVSGPGPCTTDDAYGRGVAGSFPVG